MRKLKFFLIIFVLTIGISASGQITATIKTITEEQMIRTRLLALTDTNMYGRGYVKNGKENASIYIQNKFKELKLRGITKDGGYVQNYYFPVNTFPSAMKLSINNEELVPGEDYIIDPASTSFNRRRMEIQTVDLKQVVDTAGWVELVNSFKPEVVYYFDEIETVCKNLNIKKGVFPYILPHGCYIINAGDKLTWSVTMDTCRATIFYIKEGSVPKKMRTADVSVYSEYIPKAKNENIIGVLPGKVKDTFIVFTAHYDHLGMMGDRTIFPGASDNASGTAMMLYLASYFSQHPQKYSLLFIAFSGEEAELIGSKFYTKHPVVPLKNIKFLTNIDIMGDASFGITVVNATAFPKEFDMLEKINARNRYLPAIKARGRAANSDHYYFTEAGVPSFFIYSNGGKGFYHDVYDKGTEVSLRGVDGVAKLLIDFANMYNYLAIIY